MVIFTINNPWVFPKIWNAEIEVMKSSKVENEEREEREIVQDNVLAGGFNPSEKY